MPGTRLSGTLGSWIQALIEIAIGSIGFNRDSSVLDLLTLSWREGDGGFFGEYHIYIYVKSLHKVMLVDNPFWRALSNRTLNKILENPRFGMLLVVNGTVDDVNPADPI